MTAKLINLGRNKINKYVDVKNEKQLHIEIGKHLRSKDWEMGETEDTDVWAITTGWHTVGHVQILTP